MRRNKNRKLGFWNTFLLMVNIPFSLFLLLSYTAALINPADFWLPAFFGLAYPVLFIVNIIFLITWIIKLKKFFFISLIVIIIGWNHIDGFFQARIKTKYAPESAFIKVMSYNTNIFGIYSKLNRFEKKNKILKLIDNERPDILCMQEFVHYSSGKEVALIDSLQHILPGYKHYVEFTSSAKNISHFGSIIFCRYPIINTGKIRFNEYSDNICMYCDVILGSDTIRIVNVHLQSIKMKDEDYKFAEDLSKAKNLNERDEIRQNSVRIAKRLKRAFAKRSPQSVTIREMIEECPYPVILCGDFNDTPSSYTYTQISSNLQDAFVESGKGLGKTYRGVFPSFRIDYIMHDPLFKSYEFETLDVSYSDHYPVTCKLLLPPS